ncbi:hypothetical protein C8Q74DRAFT_1318439 [Fomes fomentarius]|nr:hypothetical protein C8Q74DRAFT_1318439 [Fomes fomentarius]
MEYLNARLDSFALKSKRSKASSSKTASPLKWPHSSSFKATPETLAEAGFYYNPEPDSPDNVTCFMCRKTLGGWEPDDDPFTIHYDKCRNTCAWAVVRCQRGVGDLSDDISDSTRHPTNKAMEKARLDIAAKVRWPHDTTKNHGANSKALAKAGFVCNPTEAGDDTAVCIHCNLTLSGWDADDDPYEEHLKRDKKKGTACAFLKAQSTISLGKSTTKPPEADSDDGPAATPSDASQSRRPSGGRQSKASSARSSSMAAKTPASRRSTRGAGKTPGSRTVSSEVEETDGGSESDASRRTSKAKRKTGGRAKSRVSAIVEEDDEAQGSDVKEEDVEMQEQEPEPELPKRRGRPPKSAAAKPASQAKGKKAQVQQKEETIPQESEVEPPPVVKKTHGRTRSKANLDTDDKTAPSSSKGTHTRTKSGSKTKVKEEDVQELVIPAPAPKKTSKQTVPAPSQDEDEDEDVPSAPPKRPKGKAVPRSKVKIEEPQGSDDATVEREEKVHNRTQSGLTAASRRSRSPAERKSSLSEDAGYATAEPPPEADHMDLDEPTAPINNTAPVFQRTEAPLRASSRATPEDSGRRPSPATNGVRSSGVTSSSQASNPHPPSKLVKNPLKVIEIDSDGEETGVFGVPAKAAAKGKAPLTRLGSTNLVNGAKKQASKKKMQVEVVIPPRPSSHSQAPAEAEDVKMDVDQPKSPAHPQLERGATPDGAEARAEPTPSVSDTPISAVHLSAPPSPIRDDAEDSDVPMPDPDAEIVAAVLGSPRTYHPYLAQFPVEKLGSLTEEEAEMTLEQYIRREMELQYAQFKADAERRIDEFKAKAAETRTLIETS